MINLAFLLSSTSSNGGIERATSILANNLVKRGVAKVFAVGFHPRQLDQRVYEWDQSVVHFDLFSVKRGMKKGIFSAIPRLRRFLKKNNIDVLIPCGHIYAPLGGFACIGSRTKMIYWSHSSFFGEPNPFKRFNEHMAGLFSKAVVCLTKADIKNYQKKTFARKVVQIYNPIDENLLGNKSRYNPDTKKIISVGRLAHPKNFETYLLDVATFVLKENPEYSWHIYGKGEFKGLIEERIHLMGLQDRVVLMGNVNNLYEIYPEYSIMVMTSSYEGFPMTLLEGLVMSIPLVSFDIPTGPNEIIRNNVNGFLIPPYSVADMAEKLNMLIEDRSLRIKFSEANRSGLNEFNIEKTLPKWIDLLASVTN
jgi:glycosyltransferase involved in cell wall biosynthesis